MEKFYLVVKDPMLLEHSLINTLEKESLIAYDVKEATKIFVLGGDGTMLHAVNKYHGLKLPFCGFNFGHVGFLMNKPTQKVLLEIIHHRTRSIFVKLLEAELFSSEGKKLTTEFAFNDFYFEKTDLPTAKIKITVDGKVRFDPLICNGVLVSTPVGSTAYNASAGGEILPIETEAIVLTAICPAVFHRWRSSILPKDAEVILEPLDVSDRPVVFVADGKGIPNVAKAVIRRSVLEVSLQFAESQDFREKFLKLKF